MFIRFVPIKCSDIYKILLAMHNRHQELWCSRRNSTI